MLLSLLLLGLSVQAQPELAQSQPQSQLSGLQGLWTIAQNFEPPGDDRPQSTGVGGSRDDFACAPGEEPIQALTPTKVSTSEPHPTILLDLPETMAQEALLSFRGITVDYTQRVFLPLPDQPQVVGLTLPQNAPPLVVGEEYQWSLAIVCEDFLKPSDPLFRGWMERI
jgi:hypothetical protein